MQILFLKKTQLLLLLPDFEDIKVSMSCDFPVLNLGKTRVIIYGLKNLRDSLSN